MSGSIGRGFVPDPEAATLRPRAGRGVGRPSRRFGALLLGSTRMVFLVPLSIPQILPGRH